MDVVSSDCATCPTYLGDCVTVHELGYYHVCDTCYRHRLTAAQIRGLRRSFWPDSLGDRAGT